MVHSLFGVKINDIGPSEFKKYVSQWLLEKEGRVVFTPNEEMILEARQNEMFRLLLNQSDLSIPDSISLKFAVAALSDGILSHRLPGVDALMIIASECARANKKLILLGGEHSVSELAADKLKKKFQNLCVSWCGIGNVYFEGDDVMIDGKVVNELVDKRADVVAVALGQKKQEFAINKLRKSVQGVKIWIGVGGALDMISGIKPRAPLDFRKLGFEWFWRFCLEPSRWRRIMNATIVFPSFVFLDTLKRRRACKSIWKVIKEFVVLFKVYEDQN